MEVDILRDEIIIAARDVVFARDVRMQYKVEMDKLAQAFKEYDDFQKRIHAT